MTAETPLVDDLAALIRSVLYGRFAVGRAEALISRLGIGQNDADDAEAIGERLRAALGLAPDDAASFTVDGEIFSMQAEPKADPKDQCLCCRPRGHVFCHGVHVPSVLVPGINGGRHPGSVNDWLWRVLHGYRFDGGRKVRVTLEILADDDEVPATKAAS